VKFVVVLETADRETRFLGGDPYWMPAAECWAKPFPSEAAADAAAWAARRLLGGVVNHHVRRSAVQEELVKQVREFWGF
jgi:2-methylcitrate dehydratase PrpD